MNRMIMALLLAAGLAGPAIAQTVAADMAVGEVRKVDKGAKQITIKHGEIKNLGMPPMTMVFQVRDPALLNKVKAGDKVKFQAEKQGDAYVVTAIEVKR
jgi:Cu(I)/Ag(I) efflux system periplasmic protein CusF